MPESSAQSASPLLAQTCAACHTTFAARELSCPSCQRLVHAEQLKQLSQRAAAHAATAEREQELTTWREALALLPQGSRQHAQITAKIEALVASAPATEAQEAGKSRQGLGKLAAAGGLGALLWKLKWVLLWVFGKGKLLLFGLTKLSTLASMLVSLGVYWSIWGWQFALGLVLSIYVHEMGHIAALRRLGIAASAPMFVPGLGAFVRARQYPVSPAEDAEVGLAGPIYGLAAALTCFAIAKLSGAALFAAVAQIGAVINLFNLVPFGSLDGGRGFRALSRAQRFLACAALLGALLVSGERLLILLLGVAALRAWLEAAPAAPGDQRALVKYALLVFVLALLSTLHVEAPETVLMGMNP
jgi:Zn-dependent protease